MGKYLNPGVMSFQQVLNSEIYVDKTGLISYINSLVNTEQRYACVLRPRRFGKTIAANMLTAYYGKGESRQLFTGRMIAEREGWEQYLNHFDVLRVVMTDFIKGGRNVRESLEKMQKRIIRDLKRQYPEVDYYDEEDLIQSLSDVYEEKETQFVIIIDEWDAVFRACKEDKDGQKIYLDFLRDWFKDQEYVALVYMTGIFPIKKYGQHSALNMFDEYSIITPMQLAPYTGFTEEEVKNVCDKYGRDYNKVKEWYDGYDVMDVVPPDPNYEMQKVTGSEMKPNHYSIYSPLSVVKAVSTGMIQNYWNKTENYEALAEYIRMNYDGLKESVALLMDGGKVGVNISSYQNDMTSFRGSNDVLVMLIHLGYLGYHADTREVFIPNNEILDEFKTSTESDEWAETLKSFRKSCELLEATWNCNEEKVARILEWFHDSAENRTYHSEEALSYAIQMAYYAGQKYYTTIQELDSGKGYADLVYLPSPKCPDKPALLIELKYNKSAETAADQIRNREYMQKLEHYKGNLLIVGVNYNRDADAGDDEYKHHTCRIEKA
ncbi:MAG: AAA family ATPase [Lachnospiraceae bacterium]|nr:AAA family ATPase [Lachnospiraceae bacterium]